VIGINHHSPPIQAQRSKAFAKKSRSTTSWPILACSFVTSASRPACASEALSNALDRFSMACRCCCPSAAEQSGTGQESDARSPDCGVLAIQAAAWLQTCRCRRGGKTIVPKEPVASIVQDVLNGFASRRFRSPAEIKRFLEMQPAFPRPAGNEDWYDVIDRMLRNILYTGHLECPKWGVSLRRGKHPP